MLNGLEYHIKRIRSYEKAACRFASNLNALSKKYHPSSVPDIEHFGGNNNLVIFTPTKIHQKIVNEAISLLELFFGFQP